MREFLKTLENEIDQFEELISVYSLTFRHLVTVAWLANASFIL